MYRYRHCLYMSTHCNLLHRKLNILSSKTDIIAVFDKKIGAAKREELHCPIPWGGLLSVTLPHCSDEQPFTFPVARRTHAGHFPARAAPAPANPLATPIPKAEEQRLPCRNLSIRHSFYKTSFHSPSCKADWTRRKTCFTQPEAIHM